MRGKDHQPSPDLSGSEGVAIVYLDFLFGTDYEPRKEELFSYIDIDDLNLVLS